MAKSTAYLLQYKNYYNKSLDRLNTLSEYMEYMCVGPQGNPINEVDFKPNDNVNATLTINWEGEHPDYVLVDTSGTISRWYVLESNRTRQGQYILTLYRDLLVDYMEVIEASPLIVHKGYCGMDDPAIFNNENITVNQIKQREQLLKDNTRCPWVVGYCSVPKDGENIPAINYGLSSDVYNIYTPAIDDWEYNQYEGINNWIDSVEFSIAFDRTDEVNPSFTFDRYGNLISSSWTGEFDNITNGYRFMDDAYSWNELVNNIKSYIDPAIYEVFISQKQMLTDRTLLSELSDLNGDIIKIGTDTYRTIQFERLAQQTRSETVAPNTKLGTVFEEIIAQIKAKYTIQGAVNAVNFRITYKYTPYSLIYGNYTPYEGLTFDWPKSRVALTDAPYCLFCMPYSDSFYVATTAETGYYTNKDNALSIASGIATALGSSLYDIQLLPYCPYDLIRNSQDQLDMGLVYANLVAEPYLSMNTDTETGYIELENAHQIIFFSPVSTGTFTIDFESYDDFDYTSNIQKKAKAITQFYRLNSPNYNSTYEFNPHKNNGVAYFKVDYAYKPFQPYIHVAPNWGGLYGEDFNDARGLICGGDFSLPIVNDEWTNYMINNKNFNEIFDRQIETNDYVRKWQRAQEITGMITGTAIGAGSGFGVGSMMSPGSNLGMIGAVSGGVASLAGGIADTIANQKIYNKQKQLTIDTFTLNNQNVQARPYALSKVGALNPNNKLFPFVEVYGTTEEEYINLTFTLGLTGFTIERIGYLESYLQFKPVGIHGKLSATIPYIYDLIEDSHIAFEINQELEEGVII